MAIFPCNRRDDLTCNMGGHALEGLLLRKEHGCKSSRVVKAHFPAFSPRLDRLYNMILVIKEDVALVPLYKYYIFPSPRIHTHTLSLSHTHSLSLNVCVYVCMYVSHVLFSSISFFLLLHLHQLYVNLSFSTALSPTTPRRPYAFLAAQPCSCLAHLSPQVCGSRLPCMP